MITAKTAYDKRVEDMKGAKDKFDAAETKFKDFQTKWDTQAAIMETNKAD